MGSSRVVFRPALLLCCCWGQPVNGTCLRQGEDELSGVNVGSDNIHPWSTKSYASYPYLFLRMCFLSNLIRIGLTPHSVLSTTVNEGRLHQRPGVQETSTSCCHELFYFKVYAKMHSLLFRLRDKKNNADSSGNCVDHLAASTYFQRLKGPVREISRKAEFSHRLKT